MDKQECHSSYNLEECKKNFFLFKIASNSAESSREKATFPGVLSTNHRDITDKTDGRVSL